MGRDRREGDGDEGVTSGRGEDDGVGDDNDGDGDGADNGGSMCRWKLMRVNPQLRLRGGENGGIRYKSRISFSSSDRLCI
jgi:hypothetical protein